MTNIDECSRRLHADAKNDDFDFKMTWTALFLSSSSSYCWFFTQVRFFDLGCSSLRLHFRFGHVNINFDRS
jgi:hypothetical protein